MSEFTPSESESLSLNWMELRRSERHKSDKNDKNTQNLSPQRLFNLISRVIAESKETQYLTFEKVDPEAGSLVVASLNEDARVERVTHR